jgi:NADH-quinone oxidoreductase subunit N
MQNNFQSLSYFLPELAIIATIMFVVLSDLVSDLKKYNYYISVCGLLLVVLLLVLGGYSTNGKQLFNDMLIFDSFSYFFKSIILLSTLSIIIVSKYSKELDNEYRAEYNTLILVVLLGMFLMTNSINLIMIYLSLELVSIPSYVLAGILKNDRKSNEASLKYVIFGSFASGLMLFGFSLLYGLTGSLYIYDIHTFLLDINNPSAVLFSIILIIAGFGYKISMVPFHYWTPDVYEGSPTTVTAFLSVAPKAAGFALFLRFFTSVFTVDGSINSTSPLLGIDWPLLLAILSAVTMTVGNIISLRQDNVKRMLAYSTISHVGFILMAVCTLNTLAIYGMMFYILMYTFMNLSAFYMIIHMSNAYNAENIDDWKGIGFKHPILSAFMVITLVSLAGLPPTSGFVGKVYLFRGLFIDKEFFWLGIIAVINSVVSLYYYFKIVKSMYFFERDELEKKKAHSVIYWSIIVLSSQNLLFYIYWSDLYNYIINLF